MEKRGRGNAAITAPISTSLIATTTSKSWVARIDPRIVLDGEFPRLIDEYQLVEGLWEAVRGRIDDLRRKGLFLLAGSATPEEGRRLHTGARRIAPVSMRTMTLLERGLSTGAVSLGTLLDGGPAPQVGDRITVTQVTEALSIGGWPDNLDLTPREALEANVDYLDMIVHTDIRRIDGIDRNPDGVRRLIASYARNVATDAALRTIGRTAERPLSEATLHDYLNALRRLFLIEDQESWSPELRSRIRLAATPKRHLADPSLAVAALGATPERLRGPRSSCWGSSSSHRSSTICGSMASPIGPRFASTGTTRASRWMPSWNPRTVAGSAWR